MILWRIMILIWNLRNEFHSLYPCIANNYRRHTGIRVHYNNPLHYKGLKQKMTLDKYLGKYMICYNDRSPQMNELDRMYLPCRARHLLSCLLSGSASKPLLANLAPSFTKRYFPSVALFRKTTITTRANLNTIFSSVNDDYMKTSSCFSSICCLVSSTFL